VCVITITLFFEKTVKCFYFYFLIAMIIVMMKNKL
jgi:hypothetical protein